MQKHKFERVWFVWSVDNFFLARELVRMELERGVNKPCETGLQMAGCHPHGDSHSLEEKL